MPSDSPDKTYYCTQCQIETTMGKVCPKCHRKTTLRRRDQPIDNREGGGRREVSSASVAAHRGPARWVWVLGGAAATAALLGAIWWAFARGPNRQASPRTATSAARESGSASPETSSRVFGAPRPGARVAPPGPPKICGQAYRASIHYRFAPSSKPTTGKATRAPKPRKAAKAGRTPKPRTSPRRPAPPPSRKGPETLQQRHTFLVARRRGGRIYVPLAFEIRVTLGGRTVTALKLDRSGGILPDRRTRRPRRLGYHDSLQPGLRVSDLIGRVQADLVPEPRGGLRITRQRLRNRMVSQWLQVGLGLASFLHPRAPKAGARAFEDRRLPPGGIAEGLKSLVRRFRRRRAKKPGAAGASVTYDVDSPRLSMRRAKSTTPARGQVSLAPGDPLPRKAELRLDHLPRKGGGTQTITLRLDHLGPRCNDK